MSLHWDIRGSCPEKGFCSSCPKKGYNLSKMAWNWNPTNNQPLPHTMLSSMAGCFKKQLNHIFGSAEHYMLRSK